MATTIVRFSTDPQASALEALRAQTAHDDARINATGKVFRARLRGKVGIQTVWAYTAAGLPTTAFITTTQAELIGVCTWHLCGAKAEYVGAGVAPFRCASHAQLGMRNL